MARSIDIVRAPKSKMRIYNGERASEDFFSDEPAGESKPRDSLIWYLLLGLILIIGAVLISVYFVFIRPQQSAKNKEDKTQETAQTSETASATAASDTGQSAESPQPPEAPAGQSASAEVDKSQITIKIANGNGRQGEAAEVREILKENGFTEEIGVGNARSRYETTIIYYNTDKLKQAEAVNEVISSKYETSLLEAPKVTGGTYDVVVALGIK